jgi:hypothetical protein
MKRWMQILDECIRATGREVPEDGDLAPASAGPAATSPQNNLDLGSKGNIAPAEPSEEISKERGSLDQLLGGKESGGARRPSVTKARVDWSDPTFREQKIGSSKTERRGSEQKVSFIEGGGPKNPKLRFKAIVHAVTQANKA